MTVGCKNPCDDIERLKVCGTCAHWHEGAEGDFDEGVIASWCCAEVGKRWWYNSEIETYSHDPCHFTPSKWRPYWEEP